MSSSAKQEKKKISPKTQQIIDIVVTSVEALIVVICIIVSVTAWVGLSKPQSRALNWFAIQTDSMMGNNADSLNPGDLMFAKSVKSIEELNVGDVVAYSGTVRDSKGELHENQIITHRIVAIDKVNNRIKTQGDNTPSPDGTEKTFEDIIGKYSGKLKGIGKVILWLGGYDEVPTNSGTWLNTKTNEVAANEGGIAPDNSGDWTLTGGYGYELGHKTTSFLVIIIPLALLFVYNGYIVAKWVLDERAKKIRAAALAEAQFDASINAENEAEIKRAALVEFMKSQGMTEEQIDAYFAQQAASEQAEAKEGEEVSETEQAAEVEQADDTQDKPQE